MPCTPVPARGTAWLTELTETAASTAAYRSVWLWAWAEMVKHTRRKRSTHFTHINKHKLGTVTYKKGSGEGIRYAAQHFPVISWWLKQKFKKKTNSVFTCHHCVQKIGFLRRKYISLLATVFKTLNLTLYTSAWCGWWPETSPPQRNSKAIRKHEQRARFLQTKPTLQASKECREAFFNTWLSREIRNRMPLILHYALNRGYSLDVLPSGSPPCVHAINLKADTMRISSLQAVNVHTHWQCPTMRTWYRSWNMQYLWIRWHMKPMCGSEISQPWVWDSDSSKNTWKLEDNKDPKPKTRFRRKHFNWSSDWIGFLNKPAAF